MKNVSPLPNFFKVQRALSPTGEFSEIIKLAGGLGALSDGHILPYWRIFLGHSFRSCACKFFQIGFFVISSTPVYIPLPSWHYHDVSLSSSSSFAVCELHICLFRTIFFQDISKLFSVTRHGNN